MIRDKPHVIGDKPDMTRDKPTVIKDKSTVIRDKSTDKKLTLLSNNHFLTIVKKWLFEFWVKLFKTFMERQKPSWKDKNLYGKELFLTLA